VSCPVLSGGGGMVVRNVDVVFSAQRVAAGSSIDGLVIVRAPERFRQLNPPSAMLERFGTGQLRHRGGGGSVGSKIFIIDAAATTVWADDSLPIPLEADNNVLMIEVDSGGAIISSEQTRIDSYLPQVSGKCSATGYLEYRERRDALWSLFQSAPAIRRFVTR
jgi:hypothetical protein